MILLLDIILNNYIGLLSCFIILLIPTLTKYKFITLLTVDIVLNNIPIISFIIAFVS